MDRELQSTELARIMAASYPKPVIFLGYVVTTPRAKRRELLDITKSRSVQKTDTSLANPYEIMVTDGRVHDIDADDLDRW